jgi:hypothetical protein
MLRRDYGKKRRQRMENLLANKAASLAGEGLFLFQNNTLGELILPKPPFGSSNTTIAKGAIFKGDSYFLSLVRTADLKFLGEATQEDTKIMKEEKLILEQPPTVTPKGSVEHFVEKPETKKKKLSESDDPNPEPAILLTEDPVGGIVIMD